MIVAVYTALSRGVLNLKMSDGSTRWCLAVRAALNFVGSTDVTRSAASLSIAEKSALVDKWRKLEHAGKI